MQMGKIQIVSDWQFGHQTISKIRSKIHMDRWKKYRNLAYIAKISMIAVYNPPWRNMYFYFLHFQFRALGHDCYIIKQQNAHT